MGKLRCICSRNMFKSIFVIQDFVYVSFNWHKMIFENLDKKADVKFKVPIEKFKILCDEHIKKYSVNNLIIYCRFDFDKTLWHPTKIEEYANIGRLYVKPYTGDLLSVTINYTKTLFTCVNEVKNIFDVEFVEKVEL